MTAYYNEIDPYAAEWLRNLIDAGHIAPGVVDERDMRDIKPDDLCGFTQCHFFAGIGIWSAALRRAGWADDRPIWTGSCPCQPFSAAGGRGGVHDERHLWPHWFHLVTQCAPSIVVGEQVASKDGLGWLDLVSTDMEGADYAFGASDLCAAGFGGAHIRQRLYFVGVADAGSFGQRESGERDAKAGRNGAGECGDASRLADDDDARSQRHARNGVNGDKSRRFGSFANGQDRASGAAGSVANADGPNAAQERASHDAIDEQRAALGRRAIVAAGAGARGRIRSGDHSPRRGQSFRLGADERVAHAMHAGRPERGTGARIGQASGVRATNGVVYADGRDASAERQQHGGEYRQQPDDGCGGSWTLHHSRQVRSLDDADWLLCRNPAGEPSWRPVEPGTFPLAHGVTCRMDKLRAYGNGLDLETATGFIEAIM